MFSFLVISNDNENVKKDDYIHIENKTISFTLNEIYIFLKITFFVYFLSPLVLSALFLYFNSYGAYSIDINNNHPPDPNND